MSYGANSALKGELPRDVVRRSAIVTLIAFFTLIDLFGSQAILPQLVEHYSVDRSTMGLAINATTLGMAVSGLIVGWYANRINRKRGIWLSLLALSIPTFLLGTTDNITIFTVLRVAQGILMATAFTLTLTYFSEKCDYTAAGGAMAAFITGNVASNLFGRVLAVSATDYLGLDGSFFFFAVLNLCGAVLAFYVIGSKDLEKLTDKRAPLETWKGHLQNPQLSTAFGIGFTILFVFVGVFTYVNFHLIENLGVAPANLGFVYLVFVPALFTTPLASKAARRFGSRAVFWIATATVCLGLALTFSTLLSLVLIGLALIGSGAFFANAVVTGFVSHAAQGGKAAANGLYLTSYYLGGLAGAFVLGKASTAGGWPLVAMIVLSVLVFAGFLATALVEKN